MRSNLSVAVKLDVIVIGDGGYDVLEGHQVALLLQLELQECSRTIMRSVRIGIDRFTCQAESKVLFRLFSCESDSHARKGAQHYAWDGMAFNLEVLNELES